MFTPGACKYLHPDLLDPSPTTLDAAKSPLALLAQTCNSIGEDTCVTPIIPHVDKKGTESSHTPEAKRPSSFDCRGHLDSPSQLCKQTLRSVVSGDVGQVPDRTERLRHRAPDDKHVHCEDIHRRHGNAPTALLSAPSQAKNCSSSNYNSCSSAGVMSSCSQGPSPQAGSSRGNAEDQTATGNAGSNRVSGLVASVSPSRATSSPSSVAFHAHSTHTVCRPQSATHGTHTDVCRPQSATHSTHTDVCRPQSATHGTHTDVCRPQSATYPVHVPGLSSNHHSSAADFNIGLLEFSPSLHLYQSAMAGHSGLTSLSASAAAVPSPVAGVTGHGGCALPIRPAFGGVQAPCVPPGCAPVCLDPYCTSCQPTTHTPRRSILCPSPSCSSCARDKFAASLSFASSQSPGCGSLPPIPPLSPPSAVSGSMAGAMLGHRLLPAAAHHGVGNVCSCQAGSEYCGKRFACPEELMHHLRTHTPLVTDPWALPAYRAVALYPGWMAAAAAGCHGHYPGLSLGASSLLRSDRRSASPLTSLMSGNRYQPYKAPARLSPSPVPPLLAVGPYYSPSPEYRPQLQGAAGPSL